MNDIFRQIAKENGTTEKAVKEEMQFAIREAMKSVEPAISSPASSTWAMLTRLDVGEEAVAFTLSVSSFNVDKSVSSAS